MYHFPFLTFGFLFFIFSCHENIKVEFSGTSSIEIPLIITKENRVLVNIVKPISGQMILDTGSEKTIISSQKLDKFQYKLTNGSGKIKGLVLNGLDYREAIVNELGLENLFMRNFPVYITTLDNNIFGAQLDSLGILGAIPLTLFPCTFDFSRGKFRLGRNTEIEKLDNSNMTDCWMSENKLLWARILGEFGIQDYFLIDTGSPLSTISEDFAKKYKKILEDNFLINERTPTVTFESLNSTAKKFSRGKFLFEVSKFKNSEYQLILGMDFLKSYVLYVNPENKKFLLFRSSNSN